MIDVDLYGLSFKELDLLEPEEESIFDFGRALRSVFRGPSAMAVDDWRGLVEKVRRSAEALTLLNLRLREDFRRTIYAVKGQLPSPLLRWRND